MAASVGWEVTRNLILWRARQSPYIYLAILSLERTLALVARPPIRMYTKSITHLTRFDGAHAIGPCILVCLPKEEGAPATTGISPNWTFFNRAPSEAALNVPHAQFFGPDRLFQRNGVDWQTRWNERGMTHLSLNDDRTLNFNLTSLY